MRRPARKYGSAAGRRSSRSVAKRCAPYSRNRSTSSAGAAANPAAVLAKTGKNATMVAHTTSEAKGSPTHTTMSGAMATMGVTWRTTAQGWMAAANRRLDAIASAMATPSTAAATSAAKVTSRVEASETSNPQGSARKAAMIANGPGTR